MSDAELIETIAEYATFLASSTAPGAQHWAAKLSQAIAQGGDDTAAVAKTVLSFYGGMGSINDIVFDFQSADRERYHELNERVYLLAYAISRPKPSA